MKITMQSPFNGTSNVMDVPITEDEYKLLINPFKLIPKLFPHLTEEQVEFLATGATPGDTYCITEMQSNASEYDYYQDWEDIPF